MANVSYNSVCRDLKDSKFAISSKWTSLSRRKRQRVKLLSSEFKARLNAILGGVE